MNRHLMEQRLQLVRQMRIYSVQLQQIRFYVEMFAYSLVNTLNCWLTHIKFYYS